MGPPPGDSENTCHIRYVEWLRYSLDKSHKFVFDNTQTAAHRQTYYYDRGLKERSFIVGDFVWRWYPPAIYNKLGQGWTGPYRINKKLSDVVYIIQKDSSSREFSIHVDHLKPYQGINPPIWDEVVDNCVTSSVPTSEISSSSDSLVVSPPRPLITRTGRVIKPRDIYSP